MDSDKNIKKMEKLFDAQEKQKKNQLRFALASIESEVNELNRWLDILRLAMTRNHKKSADSLDAEKNFFETALRNLNNYFIVYPLGDLSVDFTDQLLDLVERAKGWVNGYPDIDPTYIQVKINAILDSLTEIKKDFSQPSD